jgi:hypothetical protein
MDTANVVVVDESLQGTPLQGTGVMKRSAIARTQRALWNGLGFKKRTQLVVARGWSAGFIVAEQLPGEA